MIEPSLVSVAGSCKCMPQCACARRDYGVDSLGRARQPFALVSRKVLTKLTKLALDLPTRAKSTKQIDETDCVCFRGQGGLSSAHGVLVALSFWLWPW